MMDLNAENKPVLLRVGQAPEMIPAGADVSPAVMVVGLYGCAV